LWQKEKKLKEINKILCLCNNNLVQLKVNIIIQICPWICAYMLH